ncbi:MULTISPECIES: hypothetical protein [Dyella]|uniref:Uncharacterized protein n=2 Tax=Dyella TaxID=231454 RepID=A0A4R0YQ32_9GAMM|nr:MULTISPECIES: hypothetical protein [Dyella]TBR35937.1 hypothetical protein EYV96_18275 [Dyella terrae]TCI08516.1 hypothetical protein EZM97_28280 [Dyella soli]
MSSPVFLYRFVYGLCGGNHVRVRGADIENLGNKVIQVMNTPHKVPGARHTFGGFPCPSETRTEKLRELERDASRKIGQINRKKWLYRHANAKRESLSVLIATINNELATVKACVARPLDEFQAFTNSRLDEERGMSVSRAREAEVLMFLQSFQSPAAHTTRGGPDEPPDIASP